MKALLIHYPKCSTCQKARKWLDDHHIEYTTRDIKEDHPKPFEIKEWIQSYDIPIKKLFNTSGLVYKELSLKDKLDTMSQQEKIDILGSNGMLVKRPIVIYKNKIYIGFKEKEWENMK